MLMQPTIEKLVAMKLAGMAEALRRQLEDPEMGHLSFEDRIGLLVDQQWTWRENKALTRRLKNARLKLDAAVEDIDYRHPRRLDRPLIRSLSACGWVTQHQNILILGPTGIGKSFLACALAQKAVRDGFTALYARAPRLLRDLAVARVDGQPRQTPGPDRPYRRADRRRLGDGSPGRHGAPRLLGNLRRPLRHPLHYPDQPDPLSSLARSNWRSHRRRQHPRPRRSQCAPHRTPGSLDAENQNCQIVRYRFGTTVRRKKAGSLRVVGTPDRRL